MYNIYCRKVTFMKKCLSLIISVLMVSNLFITGFAVNSATPSEASPSDAAEAAESIPAVESLDTSAIDGKMIIYKGIEDYIVIYPQPEESEPLFDVRRTTVSFSEEGIAEARPEKNEEYRFGSIIIKGIKIGKTVLTVSDPDSGLSCSVEITVIPAFGYYIRNFFINLEYLPFMIFMWIAGMISK